MRREPVARSAGGRSDKARGGKVSEPQSNTKLPGVQGTEP